MSDSPWGCGADVLVSFPRSGLGSPGPLQLYPGLLVLSAACGVLSGALSAALLLRVCVRRFTASREGPSLLQVQEPDEGQNQAKNPGLKVSATEKAPVNSDVTAFATRARVVYPINQKYRPLADGASNPSLHDAGVPPVHTAPPPSSSCSDDDEDDDDIDDEDRDSEGQNGGDHFVSSDPQTVHSFTPVSCPLLTLTLSGAERRVSLYFWALGEVQQMCVQQQEEQAQVSSQILKQVFVHFSKTKPDSDSCTHLLQELKEWSQSLSSCSSLTSDPTFDPTCDPEEREGGVTVEEVEQWQKELHQNQLQKSQIFSEHLEHLSKHLSNSEFAPQIFSSFHKSFLHLEQHLQNLQETSLNRILQGVLWWEEVLSLLQTQPALLKQEVLLLQSLVSQHLEQSGVPMKNILMEIQESVSAELDQFHQECMTQTRRLVTEAMKRLEMKRRKRRRTQSRERRRVLEQRHREEEVTQVLQALILKQHSSETEEQEQQELLNAVSDLWRSLRSSCSSRCSSRCRLLLLSVWSESGLNQDQTLRLWSDLEHNLSLHLRQAEEGGMEQLQKTRERLYIQNQMWTEDRTLLKACLKRLCEEQTKILQSLELRLSSSDSQMGRLVSQRLLHLQGALHRLFMLRHISLTLLKEMKLSVLSTDHLQSTRTPVTPVHEGAEWESGVELLQRHLQTIVGNVLSHTLQQELPLEEESGTDNVKKRLAEAASESVYLTKPSLTALVHKYYSLLEGALQRLQQDAATNRHDQQGEQQSSESLQSLLRELEIWSRKLTSADCYPRVKHIKRRLLLQTHTETQGLFEKLRLQKINSEINLDQTKDRIMGAEEDFLQELTAAARVSLKRPEEEEERDPVTFDLRDLLTLNPALDPALNPSLTPLAPVKKN